MKRDQLPVLASWCVLGLCGMNLFKRYLFSSWREIAGGIPGLVHPPGDFLVYFQAWQRVKQGMIPYVVTDGSPYKYSPSILAFIGLLPGDPIRAWFIFGSLSLLFWLGAIGLGVRLKSWGDFLKLCLGLLLSWKGVLEVLDYGQMEFVLLILAVMGARSFFPFPFFSGMVLGFLPALKLPWIVFGLPFFLQAQSEQFWKWVGGFVLAWVIWLFGIPVMFFGRERALALTQSWMQILRAQPFDLYLSDINQSLLALGLRLFQESPQVQRLALAFTLISGGGLLGYLIQRRRWISGELSTLTPWLLFVQLLNPLAWRWGSVFALGAPFAAQNRALWVLVLIFLALQQNPVVHLLGFSHWTDLHPYNLVTGYWLVLIFL